MIDAQNNKCLICDEVMKKQCIDHCHNTGKIRGLLCNNCNSGIGKLKDDPELLRKGAKYLEASL